MKKSISRSRQQTKDKIENQERQLKQIKRTDSLGSVNFNDFCIHSGLKFPIKFKYPDFKVYTRKAVRMPTLTCMEFPWLNMVIMTNFSVDIPEKPHRRALAWFTKLDISRLKHGLIQPMFLSSNTSFIRNSSRQGTTAKNDQDTEREFSRIRLEVAQTASQAQLALTEEENLTIFMSMLVFNLLRQAHQSRRSPLVHTGERIEDGLKTGKQVYQIFLNSH